MIGAIVISIYPPVLRYADISRPYAFQENPEVLLELTHPANMNE